VTVSQLRQANDELASLRNQIVELEKIVDDLKIEKNLNDLAMTKLEEVLLLLDQRLPDTESISDAVNPSVPIQGEQKKRRFMKRNR
jgi:hypothetical protein